jgi:hypothetical protein
MYAEFMSRRTAKQLRLGLKEKRSWGGRRSGAGRPRTARGVAHCVRPQQCARHPIHVTLRARASVGNLREQRRLHALCDALSAGSNRFGFRVVHYSVQSTHMHLICEALDKEALARGLKGLKVRMARAINRRLDRKGSVFADRYHARALTTPCETRAGLAYALLNNRHHAKRPGRTLGEALPDPCSSAVLFDGWREPIRTRTRMRIATLARPSTWLLRTGWRKCGLVSRLEIPG